MKEKEKKEKKCKHEWELSHTDWNYPTGYSGNTDTVEFAYFYCKKCLKVVKKVIQEE